MERGEDLHKGQAEAILMAGIRKSNAITLTLTIDGTAVDGTVRVVTATTAISLEIFDGRVDRRTIVFKVKSPDGDRTITFTGTVTCDEMAFTRDVEVRRGGQQIFGAQGPRTFTATRVQ